MEVWLFVALIVLVLISEPLAEILGFVVDIRDELKNGNDRGKGKCPSEKYVSR